MTRTTRNKVARLTVLSGFLLAAVIAASVAGPHCAAQAQQERPVTFHDLISMHRLSDPQISPDGKWVTFGVATPDLDANHLVKNVWVVSVSDGKARQITQGGSDERARWAPDGKSLSFLSSRDGTPQVYIVPADGGEPIKVTSLSGGADNELWSPDGKWISFTSSVYPDCNDESCNAARDAANDKSKVKARVYEKLLFRHWNSWSDGKRSHLFVTAAGGGAPRDLTPGAGFAGPPVRPGGGGA